MRYYSAIFFCLLVLAACATPQQTAQWEFEGERPMICSQGPDCEAMWARALIWVQDHSHWKLRIVNDMLTINNCWTDP
jgi:hypothetical protein